VRPAKWTRRLPISDPEQLSCSTMLNRVFGDGSR
jgi:hypothetical protein